jgi:succinyl-CoA synthetase alpha subunit
VYGQLKRGTLRLVGPNCPGKPVLAYIAGFTAPAGKTVGHAGAIVSGSKGTPAAKAEALEARGVRVGRNPTQVSELDVEILGTRV